MNKQEMFVLIDGNSLMHRAFHALPPLSNEDGIFTNAVFGFLSMLLKVLEDYSPTHLAVTFDLHGPTFRHQDYEQYKATRKPTAPELRPQFGLLRECLTAMGIQQLSCPTFEGDDILGTFARRCEEAGIPSLIVTGDRDAMQLVTESTNVLYTKRGVTNVVRYTPALVRETFGIPPKLVPDLKGLMGDASDNIPGIPGIGEKTAVKLLSAYGSLEGVLSHADEDLHGKQKEKIVNGSYSAILSKKLATINRYAPMDDVSLESCKLKDIQEGIPYLQKLGLNSIIQRINKLCGNLHNKTDLGSSEWKETVSLETSESISGWLNTFGSPEKISVLLQQNGFSIACSDKTRYSIPFSEGLLGDGLNPYDAACALSPLFREKRHLILYDAKRFISRMSDWGLSFGAEFDDEKIIQYLLAPQLSKYESPQSASELFDAFTKDIQALEKSGMTKLYYDIELPLVETLFAMEKEGFLVDRSELISLGEAYTEQIKTLKKEIFELCQCEPFNLNSTQQLGDVLFNKLNLPAQKKTNRGFSTDAETLQRLLPLHPVISKILQFRQVSKLNSTYIDSLLQMTDKNGRIHTVFDQTTAATGRISSSEPNLQNIPVRTEMGREIRRAFIASEGCVLIDADYSQIELRLLAHLSGDAAMIDAFRSNQDIHARTAAEVYGVPFDQVTHEMRSSAKAVNFGIVYGISDYGLATNLHISRREAADFIERYFNKYPSIRFFMNKCIEDGKSKGFAETLFGRRRPLPELFSSSYNVRQFGERAAINTPVQGTAADVIKIAMNTVHRQLKASGLRAHLILQVHDELIVEAPLEERQQVMAILKESMEKAANLQVPLSADIHVAHSWDEAK